MSSSTTDRSFFVFFACTFSCWIVSPALCYTSILLYWQWYSSEYNNYTYWWMSDLITHSICLPSNVHHHTERSVQQCGIHRSMNQYSQVNTPSIVENTIYCIEHSCANFSNHMIKRIVNMGVNTNPYISATCTVTADGNVLPLYVIYPESQINHATDNKQTQILQLGCNQVMY